jgi:hypothetical protein
MVWLVDPGEQAHQEHMILGSVPADRLGMTSGMVAQVRNADQAFGVALAGFVVVARLPVHSQELVGSLPQGLVEREAFVLVIHDAFYVGAAVGVLGVLPSLI